ncbi:MAG: NAD(P)-binding protein, partial [Spirochaetia bacterium]
MTADRDFDVVIIGAGLGGSAVSYALRDAGLTVLILERGGYLKQEKENWDPVEVISKRRYDPKEEWVDQHGDRFRPRVYYNVGGSSKFFGGVALRFRRDDFNARSYPEGDTVAWPISYEDLAPFYDEAERLMWVNGQLEHEPRIRWLAGRMEGVGLHPLSLPMAIDQGATGRCQKGSPCDGFPCKVRAKGDGENSFLRPALRARGDGSMEIRTGARVTRLNHDEDGVR